MSQVFLGRPDFVPGTPPGHPDCQIPLCDFSLSVFTLHIVVSKSMLVASSARHLLVMEEKSTPHLGPPHLKVPKFESQEKKRHIDMAEASSSASVSAFF